MAGAQQMIDVDQGLLGQQPQGFGCHGEETAVSPFFNGDPVTADVMILGLIGAKWKKMGSGCGHGTILMRGRRLPASEGGRCITALPVF